MVSCSTPFSDECDALSFYSALPDFQTRDRVSLPAFAGSSDALLIVHLAKAFIKKKRPLVVFTATAADAERLLEEIPWFSADFRLALFPDWETLPYDHFSPHHDLVSLRLSTLYSITQGECDIILVPASTAVYRLPPPSYLAAYTFFLKQSARLNLDALRTQLTLAGYSHVTQVISPGEYAVRGGIVDLFPMGASQPFRIDLFDDEIENIRTFDIDTQRSLDTVNEIRLLPAREFPFDEKARVCFRQRFREVFEGDPARAMLYKEISNGHAPAGIEYWLPLFFDETASFFDYLPEGAGLCFHNDVAGAIRAFWQDALSRFNLLSGDVSRPLLSPEALFLNEEAFFIAAKPYPRINLQEGKAGITEALPPIAIDRRAEDPLSSLKHWVSTFSGRVAILAESSGRRETLLELFKSHGLAIETHKNLADFLKAQSRLALIVSPLHRGFVLPEFAWVTEAELYAGSPPRRSRRDVRRQTSLDNWLRDLSELKVGDPVVHEQHGIGRYRGLIHLDLGEGEMELLLLEYANETKLYVPVSQLYLISRYSGSDPDNAPLHTLGSPQWEKAKRRAALKAHDTAAELLALYAKRASREGHSFDFNLQDYEAFAEGFNFEETPDQAAAILAVMEDMRSGKPMDRLVCGDVGFGKTEVALRAAFCAVAGGKQVAVLCPTTLLCEQHFQTFTDRFTQIMEIWPVKIAELSRFQSAKESDTALKELAQGSIDIVIGTHKLIGSNVKFSRLGLVIIDEEHRFGVRQKEALKSLRAEVDVLTLTATPIPRTLGMALEGLRDFSVIATPPQKRLAVKTFVTGLSDGIIREALLREFKRGGQVYFVHNEVDTIDNMREKLLKLVPEARIVVGHGQMTERDLERTMREFTSQRANLLLCTTIIETGIDNPHANTIVINRADKFGLAQLHQLRGRVGRSHHQAYAYLLTPQHVDGKSTGLTKQAKQRLEAIQAMGELGAGFYLAMHDLEIRGAGEVLGEHQSGEVQEVGFNLYTEMLNRAILAMKEGKINDPGQALGVSTEINLHIPSLLPDDYVPDVHERLTLYKRLANCKSQDDIIEMQEELIDRFGELPTQTQSLLENHRLRLLCQPLGIIKLDATSQEVLIHFAPNPPIDSMRIIELIQKNRHYRLAGQDKLLLKRDLPTLSDRILAIKELLKALTS